MLERLSGFSTSELCDGSSFPRTMDYHIKPWVGDKRIVGRAVTVDVPAGEGDLIADAILQLKKGDVLVIAGKGCCDYSYWGDFRSFCARTAGAAGVVIDGSINVPVSCGGVCVRPGEIIVGDENGVCVIDPEEAEVIMEKAEKKRAAQEQVVREIRKTGILRTRIKK